MVPVALAIGAAVAYPLFIGLWKGTEYLKAAKDAEIDPVTAMTQPKQQWPTSTITNLPKFPPPPSYSTDVENPQEAWREWTPVTLQATQATMIEAYKKAYQPVIAKTQGPIQEEGIDPLLIAAGIAGSVALIMVLRK